MITEYLDNVFRENTGFLNIVEIGGNKIKGAVLNVAHNQRVSFPSERDKVDSRIMRREDY